MLLATIDNHAIKLLKVMKIIITFNWGLNFFDCWNSNLNYPNIFITLPFLKIQSNYLKIK